MLRVIAGCGVVKALRLALHEDPAPSLCRRCAGEASTILFPYFFYVVPEVASVFVVFMATSPTWLCAGRVLSCGWLLGTEGAVAAVMARRDSFVKTGNGVLVRSSFASVDDVLESVDTYGTSLGV